MAQPHLDADAKFDVCIIGLGYVGLTLATAFADVGLKVLGIEKMPEVVVSLQAGVPQFSEAGLQELLNAAIESGNLSVKGALAENDLADTYVLTVGTPLGPDGVARLDMIELAATQVAAVMPDDALVVLRSTVKIGTSRAIVGPPLAASGKKFHLAMCPERTVEGKAMSELRQLPQIVGADDKVTRDRAARLFGHLTDAVFCVSSLETAEIIKLADNTYRDLQFAFGNEIARLCDAVGVSANEVIETGKRDYQRTNIAQPGLVGGPCLEKDPHILRESARAFGLNDLEITGAARLVNERQPRESAEFVVSELNKRSAPAAARIAILGMAFKGLPETDDLRGTMALPFIDALRELLPRARFQVFDPIVAVEVLAALGKDLIVGSDISEASAEADAVVITNNNPALRAAGFSGVVQTSKPSAFVYDFWNHFGDCDPALLERTYYAVGNIGKAGS